MGRGSARLGPRASCFPEAATGDPGDLRPLRTGTGAFDGHYTTPAGESQAPSVVGALGCLTKGTKIVMRQCRDLSPLWASCHGLVDMPASQRTGAAEKGCVTGGGGANPHSVTDTTPGTRHVSGWARSAAAHDCCRGGVTCTPAGHGDSRTGILSTRHTCQSRGRRFDVQGWKQGWSRQAKGKGPHVSP